MRYLLAALLVISANAIALTDPDFEAEAERDLITLAAKIDKLADEVHATNVEVAKIVGHSHDHLDDRLRVIEYEVQKLEAGLAVFKWMVGAVGLLVPVVGLGARSFVKHQHAHAPK